jgi:hypothetical protein
MHPYFSAVENMMGHLVRVMGQPNKYVPQPTHVLLVSRLLHFNVLSLIQTACGMVFGASG